jgi:hypothetical protein
MALIRSAKLKLYFVRARAAITHLALLNDRGDIFGRGAAIAVLSDVS